MKLKLGTVGPADIGPFVWCFDEVGKAGAVRAVGESVRDPAEAFRLCIDLLDGTPRRRVSVVGVACPAFTGVSPSTAMLCRLWHEYRLVSVCPLLREL